MPDLSPAKRQKLDTHGPVFNPPVRIRDSLTTAFIPARPFSPGAVPGSLSSSVPLPPCPAPASLIKPSYASRHGEATRRQAYRLLNNLATDSPASMQLHHMHHGQQATPSAAGKNVSELLLKFFFASVNLPFGPWADRMHNKCYQLRLHRDTRHRFAGLVVSYFFNHTLLFQGDHAAATHATHLFRSFNVRWTDIPYQEQIGHPLPCDGAGLATTLADSLTSMHSYSAFESTLEPTPHEPYDLPLPSPPRRDAIVPSADPRRAPNAGVRFGDASNPGVIAVNWELRGESQSRVRMRGKGGIAGHAAYL